MADRHSGSARLVIRRAIRIDCYSLLFKNQLGPIGIDRYSCLLKERPVPGASSEVAAGLSLECDTRGSEQVDQPTPEGVRPVPGSGICLHGAGELEGRHEGGSGENTSNGSSGHGLSPLPRRGEGPPWPSRPRLRQTPDSSCGAGQIGGRLEVLAEVPQPCLLPESGRNRVLESYFSTGDRDFQFWKKRRLFSRNPLERNGIRSGIDQLNSPKKRRSKAVMAAL